MRTFAIFIDAGYFFATAGELACGEPVPRTKVRCDYEGLVRSLVGWSVETLSGGEPVRLLRCYWYDGARDGIPTEDHIKVAGLPDVKLRLGRKTSSGQKGVDGLIILDLVTLARDAGLDTAFVLSGDEDLREACLAAQQMGVRVVLLGVPAASQRSNQAATLIREADEHHVLPAAFWTAHLIMSQEPALPHFGGNESPLPEDHTLLGPLHTLVETMRERLAEPVLVSMADQRPAIPQFVDAQLLHMASEALGGTVDEGVKRALRASFWEVWDRTLAT